MSAKRITKRRQTGRLALGAVMLLAGCRYGHMPEPSPRPAPSAPASAAVAIPDGVSREDYAYLRARHIRIPVANAQLAKIPDSFDEPRDGKRLHHAVDILAPRGTAVLAADDGHVLKMRTGGAGGITLYAVDPESRFVYYYAHLDHYRKGVSEGMTLAKGDTIGFVGTTGNAPRDVPHLHFQIMRLPADGKWWTGVPVDPRPLFVE